MTNSLSELFDKISSLQQFINKYGEQFDTLTDREVEILALIANGFKNPEIAKKLDIPRSRVQNHRAGIRKKLAIRNQTDYIKYALAFGLISF